MAEKRKAYLPITVKTDSREELVRLSMLIAACIPPEAFHRENGIPIIQIYGDGAVGKSMVIEAMMKTILERYDPHDMLIEGASEQMFIEKRPSHALNHYCMASGPAGCRQIFLGFERYLYTRNEVLKGFETAAKKKSRGSLLPRFLLASMMGHAQGRLGDILQLSFYGSKTSGAIFKSKAVPGSKDNLPSYGRIKKKHTQPYFFISIGVNDKSSYISENWWKREINVTIDKTDSPHAQQFYENFKRLMVPYLEAQRAAQVKQEKPSVA